MTIEDVLREELSTPVDNETLASTWAPGKPSADHLAPYRFQPGHPGYTTGSRPAKPPSYQQLAADVDEEAKRRMVLALVRKAEKGDVRAFEELANRAEGKPATRIIVTQTDAESPLVSALQRIAQRIAASEGVTIEGESKLIEPGADSSGVSEDR